MSCGDQPWDDGMRQVETMRTETRCYAEGTDMITDIATYEEAGWAVRSITPIDGFAMVAVVFERNR